MKQMLGIKTKKKLKKMEIAGKKIVSTKEWFLMWKSWKVNEPLSLLLSKKQPFGNIEQEKEKYKYK